MSDERSCFIADFRKIWKEMFDDLCEKLLYLTTRIVDNISPYSRAFIIKKEIKVKNFVAIRRQRANS